MIEVIVVMAIVALLAGLLLAGVQRARQSVARTGCLNNLRQIGTALHSYHDARGAFPNGITHPVPRPGIPNLYGEHTEEPFGLMTWLTRILPFVEQEGLWNLAVQAHEQDPYALENPPHKARTVGLSIYLCAADSRRSPVDGPAPTSYLGVQGLDYIRTTGILYLDSRVRFADIRDGTGSTVIVGERPPSANGSHGRWYGGWGRWWTADVCLGVLEPSVPDWHPSCGSAPSSYVPGSIDNPCSIFHFWSLHASGANFLFADGSVRLLSYEVNSILPALASRAGGEPITSADF